MRAGPGGGGGGAGLPGVAGRWLSPCPPPGRYREASAEVMQVLSRFAAIERASIDEAYLDLTGSARHRLRQLRGRPLPAELLPSTFVQGLPAEPGGNGPRPADPGGKGTHRPPLCLPRMESLETGSVFSALMALKVLLLLPVVGMRLRKAAAAGWAWLTLRAPLLGSARDAVSCPL